MREDNGLAGIENETDIGRAMQPFHGAKGMRMATKSATGVISVIAIGLLWQMRAYAAESVSRKMRVALKSEARRPSYEIRRPKPEAEGDSGFGLRAGGQQQRVTSAS